MYVFTVEGTGQIKLILLTYEHIYNVTINKCIPFTLP